MPVEPAGATLELVQRWMAAPHVEAFWHQAWPLSEWSAEIDRQLAGDHCRPWIVLYEGEAVAYLEIYRASRDVLATQWPAEPHDLGLHVAIGEPAHTGQGLGRRLVLAVSDGLFTTEPACRRVLVDPDITHAAARRAFVAAGFEYVGDIDLPHKRAALLIRYRS